MITISNYSIGEYYARSLKMKNGSTVFHNRLDFELKVENYHFFINKLDIELQNLKHTI